MTSPAAGATTRPTPAAVPPVCAMANPIRDYEWGDTDTLARLQGREPDGRPEAELWMGDHPCAPSALVGEDGVALPLPELIAADPEAVLGAGCLDRFGPRLPFLLKVLAVAAPLSVQVHPGPERARQVFAAGDGPYVDGNHKPELLCALSPMRVLFGLRPPAAAAEALAAVPDGDGLLAGVLAELRGPGTEAQRNHRAVTRLLAWPAHRRSALVAGLARVAAGHGEPGGAPCAQPGCPPEAADCPSAWVRLLADSYPQDPMVAAPLLMGLVTLRPGDGLYVAAGVPHGYLSGTGVEVMAASDNVLRAGLTHKPVAVEELLTVIDCRPPERVLLAPQADGGDGPGSTSWCPPVPDFRLERVRLAAGAARRCTPVTGPQVLLCTAGRVRVDAGGGPSRHGIVLTAGHSAFLPHAAADVVVSSVGGPAEVFRARAGLGG